MNDKSYEQLIKEKEYRDIAQILLNNYDCRQDNRKLFKKYYRTIWGISVDEALDRDDVPNYQTIERKARLLKAVNHQLRVDKSKEVDVYKQIALERPVMVQLF